MTIKEFLDALTDTRMQRVINRTWSPRRTGSSFASSPLRATSIARLPRCMNATLATRTRQQRSIRPLSA